MRFGIAMTVAMVGIVFLASCRSTPNPASKLTVWDIPESEAYTQWWRDYDRRFQDAHPDIQITHEVFETQAYKAKWAAAVLSNTLPDIFYQTPGPEIDSAFNDGKLLSLDGHLDIGRFSRTAIEPCTMEGKVFGMPLYFAPSFIYYNKALFAQAGIDPQQWSDPTQPAWEEFVAACEALKDAGITPIALGNAESWTGMHWYWMFQNRYGGNEELFAAVKGEHGGSYQSAGFIKAGKLTHQLYTRGYLTEGFNGIGGAQKYTIWTQGTGGAMIYQGPWLLGYIIDTAPDDFECGFFLFPSFPDGKPESQRDIMSGIDALWVSASTPHIDTIGKYLNGFADYETQLDFVLRTQNIPAVKGIEPPPERAGDLVWQIAKAMEQAGDVIPWWDISLLPPAVTEAMMSMSQGLLIGEVSPQAFAASLDQAAGR